MTLSHLPRLAARLRLLVWLGIVMLAAMPALVWLASDLAPRWGQATALWTGGDRLIALLLTAPPYWMAALGLAQFLGFCRTVAAEAVFTPAAAESLRRFGWALIAAALLLPPSRLGLWAYIGFEAVVEASAWGRVNIGQIILSSGIGLVIGLAVLVFAGILREATRLADENASFF